jgi:hypothetical protein
MLCHFVTLLLPSHYLATFWLFEMILLLVDEMARLRNDRAPKINISANWTDRIKRTVS